ncbi:MAG: hypothetical protein Q8N51_08305, partial [Gammaproteobacteria bacterium]|nr:hypothetical protein [Gammaproteobacteria bacterium]
DRLANPNPASRSPGCTAKENLGFAAATVAGGEYKARRDQYSGAHTRTGAIGNHHDPRAVRSKIRFTHWYAIGYGAGRTKQQSGEPGQQQPVQQIPGKWVPGRWALVRLG